MQKKGFTSLFMATPFLVPLTRMTAASPPGRSTVLVWTMWSYWPQIQDFSATFGEARICRRHAPNSDGLRLRLPEKRPGRRREGRARPVVDGRPVGERRGRQVRDDPALEEENDAPRVGDAPDLDGVELPLVEDRQDLLEAVPLRDEEHPLLRLREHDLVGRHPGLTNRDLRKVELDAAAGSPRHFEGGRGQAGRTHVLDAGDRVCLEELETGLHEELLGEGITHLHRRTLLLRLVGGELLGGHRRAVNAVAARLRADVDDGVSGALGAPEEDAVGADDAEVHDVDEDVAVVALVERGLAAERRNADAVAVARDPAHHAVDEVLHPRRVEAAEAEGVEGGHGPRAHREDVAQDAADARGRALVGLDERRVVVRLHLERHGEPVADVHDAGVLARALDDAGPGGRERLQVHARRLVRAVLAPHRREDPELDEVGLAPEDLEDPLVLLVGEVVLANELVGDHRRVRIGGLSASRGPPRRTGTS